MFYSVLEIFKQIVFRSDLLVFCMIDLNDRLACSIIGIGLNANGAFDSEQSFDFAFSDESDVTTCKPEIAKCNNHR